MDNIFEFEHIAFRPLCHGWYYSAADPILYNPSDSYRGLTPVLSPMELAEIGFKLAAYPLDLLNAQIIAQRKVLAGLAASGKPRADETLPFADLQDAVGFTEYYAEEARYRVDGKP